MNLPQTGMPHLNVIDCADKGLQLRMDDHYIVVVARCIRCQKGQQERQEQLVIDVTSDFPYKG